MNIFRQITKNQLEKSKLYIICFQNEKQISLKNKNKEKKKYQMFLQYLQIHIQCPSEEEKEMGNAFQSSKVQ